jgi:membrane fusion protein, copper/silver efflux system
MKNVLVLIMCLVIFSCNTTENTNDQQETTTLTRFSDADQASLERLNSIYDEYINLKNSLVETDPAKASEAARVLAQTAKEFDYEPLEPEARVFLEERILSVDEHAEAIAGSTNVEQQRELFQPLTNDIYQIVKSFDVSEMPVYYQYCPMAFDDAGAYWLSNEKQIRNPYFGNVMLKCGEVREVIE